MDIVSVIRVSLEEAEAVDLFRKLTNSKLLPEIHGDNRIHSDRHQATDLDPSPDRLSSLQEPGVVALVRAPS